MSADNDETAEWRGPEQFTTTSAGRWFYRITPLVLLGLAIWAFIDWRNGDGAGFVVASLTCAAVAGWSNLRSTRTRVRADREGLRVFNPVTPSWRRVRWDQISHFVGREPWLGRRTDLLTAVKHDGGHVFLGLPVGHEGLTTWWERYGKQPATTAPSVPADRAS